MALVGVVVLVAGVATGCLDPQRPTPPVTPSPTRVPAPTEPASPAANVPRPGSPAAASPVAHGLLPIPVTFDRLLANEPGIYGIVAAAPDGTIIYSRNPDTPFISASLYKLVLMAAVYDRVRAGGLRFDQEIELKPEYFTGSEDELQPNGPFAAGDAGQSKPLRTVLDATVRWSSNIAARALLSVVSAAEVNAEAGKLGLPHTHFEVQPKQLPDWPPPIGPNSSRTMTDQATRFVATWTTDNGVAPSLTTPRDVATFFTMLMRGQVVSAADSAEMLDLLKGQEIDNTFPVLLPSGTVLAHKTGNLDHIVHDAGVIYGKDGRPIILAALSEDSPDDDHATAVIQRLALVAYGTDTIPPYGQRAPTGPETVTPDGTTPSDPAADQTVPDATSSANDQPADGGSGDQPPSDVQSADQTPVDVPPADNSGG